MSAIDDAVELAWMNGAQVTSQRGAFAAIFTRLGLCVSGPVNGGGYRVRWYDVNGAEATETFRTPLAAVERAIELQGELK